MMSEMEVGTAMRSGSLNLGVEGIMFMGGALGLGGVFYYEKAAGAGAMPKSSGVP